MTNYWQCELHARPLQVEFTSIYVCLALEVVVDLGSLFAILQSFSFFDRPVDHHLLRIYSCVSDAAGGLVLFARLEVTPGGPDDRVRDL